MIVWSGKGLIVPLVAFVVAGLGGLIGDTIGRQMNQPGDFAFSVGLGVGFILSGLALMVVWPRLRSDTRVLVDPKTQQRIAFNDRSSLFFIPVSAWSYLLIGLGAAWLFAMAMGYRPDPSDRRHPRLPPAAPAPTAAPTKT